LVGKLGKTGGSAELRVLGNKEQISGRWRGNKNATAGKEGRIQHMVGHPAGDGGGKGTGGKQVEVGGKKSSLGHWKRWGEVEGGG